MSERLTFMPPPFGVPPAFVELVGVIANDEGVTKVSEQLWVVGYIDPLADVGSAGNPIVLVPFHGVMPLARYVHARGITDQQWRVVTPSPAEMMHRQEMMQAAAAAAAGGPRIHVAGPLGPIR